MKLTVFLYICVGLGFLECVWTEAPPLPIFRFFCSHALCVNTIPGGWEKEMQAIHQVQKWGTLFAVWSFKWGWKVYWGPNFKEPLNTFRTTPERQTEPFQTPPMWPGNIDQVKPQMDTLQNSPQQLSSLGGLGQIIIFHLNKSHRVDVEGQGETLRLVDLQ